MTKKTIESLSLGSIEPNPYAEELLRQPEMQPYLAYYKAHLQGKEDDVETA